jgi:hypothetical protein
MFTGKLVILAIHNILRWMIVGLGIFSIIKMYLGWLRKKQWDRTDGVAGTLYTIALDIQLLVGLLLYFVFSDLTKIAFADFGNAMANATLRFFSLEHIFFMVISIVLGHIGNSIGKKDLQDSEKFKRTAILFTLSFLLLLAGIPWTTRPLFPGM